MLRIFIKIIKSICPPIIMKLFLLLRKSDKADEFGYFGNYLSWSDAEKETSGYNKGEILLKCKNALLKVKSGEAVYERDSVIFDKIDYSWPLLSSLLWIAAKNDNRLNLIDFGGSLGSTFFQNYRFLGDLTELKWNIVEQEHFVKCGKDNFEDKTLKFYYTIDECLKENKCDVILLSSVLQYLSKPYEFIEKFMEKDVRYIIVDITGFVEEDDDRLTIQKVPSEIYDASYPAWFFNKDKFLKYFSKRYDLVAEFPGYIGEVINIDNKPIAGYKGFLFEMKYN